MCLWILFDYPSNRIIFLWSENLSCLILIYFIRKTTDLNDYNNNKIFEDKLIFSKHTFENVDRKI